MCLLSVSVCCVMYSCATSHCRRLSTLPAYHRHAFCCYRVCIASLFMRFGVHTKHSHTYTFLQLYTRMCTPSKRWLTHISGWLGPTQRNWMRHVTMALALCTMGVGWCYIFDLFEAIRIMHERAIWCHSVHHMIQPRVLSAQLTQHFYYHPWTHTVTGPALIAATRNISGEAFSLLRS